MCPPRLPGKTASPAAPAARARAAAAVRTRLGRPLRRRGSGAAGARARKGGRWGGRACMRRARAATTTRVSVRGATRRGSSSPRGGAPAATTARRLRACKAGALRQSRRAPAPTRRARPAARAATTCPTAGWQACRAPAAGLSTCSVACTASGAGACTPGGTGACTAAGAGACMSRGARPGGKAGMSQAAWRFQAGASRQCLTRAWTGLAAAALSCGRRDSLHCDVSQRLLAWTVLACGVAPPPDPAAPPAVHAHTHMAQQPLCPGRPGGNAAGGRRLLPRGGGTRRRAGAPRRARGAYRGLQAQAARGAAARGRRQAAQGVMPLACLRRGGCRRVASASW